MKSTTYHPAVPTIATLGSYAGILPFIGTLTTSGFSTCLDVTINGFHPDIWHHRLGDVLGQTALACAKVSIWDQLAPDNPTALAAKANPLIVDIDPDLIDVRSDEEYVRGIYKGGVECHLLCAILTLQRCGLGTNRCAAAPWQLRRRSHSTSR